MPSPPLPPSRRAVREILLGLLVLVGGVTCTDSQTNDSLCGDEQCSPDQVCVAGRCHMSCVEDVDCPGGERCHNQVCLRPEEGVGSTASSGGATSFSASASSSVSSGASSSVSSSSSSLSSAGGPSSSSAVSSAGGPSSSSAAVSSSGAVSS
ncbi:MAG: hypothetical protein AB2A00_24105, partial [Myxococcota bacterium]